MWPCPLVPKRVEAQRNCDPTLSLLISDVTALPLYLVQTENTLHSLNGVCAERLTPVFKMQQGSSSVWDLEASEDHCSRVYFRDFHLPGALARHSI